MTEQPSKTIVRVSRPLWYEVRRIALTRSTPEQTVTVRQIIDEAVSDWLSKQRRAELAA